MASGDNTGTLSPPHSTRSKKGRCYLQDHQPYFHLLNKQEKGNPFKSQPQRAEKLSLSGWQLSSINHNKGRNPLTSSAPGRVEADGRTTQSVHGRVVEFLLPAATFDSIRRLRPCGRCSPKNKTSRGSRSLSSPAPAPCRESPAAG